MTVQKTQQLSLALKRVLDFVTAAVALVVLAPMMGIVAALIRAAMGSPVVFRQQRPGMKCKPFTLFKFRTMQEPLGPDGKPLPDEQRLTRLGRVLRRLSVDELPQLFNVLRGDLSLVGPRPLLMQYIERYTLEQMRRHEVKPGITGWAQVNGRNAVTWEERFRLDLWYVDNWSLILDLKILLLTLALVVKGEGIGHEGYESMPEYMGSRSDSRETVR